MKTLFILFFLLFLNSIVFSQISDLKKIPSRQLKTLAQNSIQMGDTYSAIDFLEEYCSRKKDGDMMYLLAESYRLARNYPYAKKWYHEAYTSNPKKHILALYYYGTMLMTEQNYEKAHEAFRRFRRELRDANIKSDIDYNRLSRNKMDACDRAFYIIDSALTVKVTHLSRSINKASIEFSPQYIHDSLLLYASLRSDTAVYKVLEQEQNTVPKRQFYLAKKTQDNWEYLMPWPEGDFNDPLFDVGNGVFSPDKQRFYFTRCEKNRRMQTICNIYVSHRDAIGWTSPEPLPEIINSKKFTATQPAIGTESRRGQEVLYFVSDRPGGRGGLDIWYSIYDARQKEWQEPRNCGPRINTPGDEITPFYDMRTRSLYFSSNGWPGLGEFDIFRNKGELARWVDVAENVGYPINSPFDDLYYIIHERGKEGFFASNRPGTVTVMHETCCDDLFSYEYVDFIDLAVTGKVYEVKNQRLSSILMGRKELLEEQAEESNEKNYIQGAIVSMFIVERSSQELLYIAQDTTKIDGSYFFSVEPNRNYILTFESFKEQPRRQPFSTHGYIVSDTIVINDIGIDFISRESFVIPNIYYEFDRHRLTNDARNTLDTTLLVILKEAPEIIIELSSHTDSMGDEGYNMRLSQRRAESVVNYLVQKGIDRNRLHPKGYGETKPIAPNSNPDGTDNPDGRQMNRRTEFRVIGTLQQYSEIIYQE